PDEQMPKGRERGQAKPLQRHDPRVDGQEVVSRCLPLVLLLAQEVAAGQTQRPEPVEAALAPQELVVEGAPLAWRERQCMGDAHRGCQVDGERLAYFDPDNRQTSRIA